MGVFWDTNQTERSLREGMIHVYFACLQDTCGLNVLYFFSGLKNKFKKKTPPRFLDYHRVSVENLRENFIFRHVQHSLDVSGHFPLKWLYQLANWLSQ